MMPSARIKASIELLEKIASSKIPMDSTIGDYMRYRRYIGSKDRAEIAERTYNIVRAHARLGWWLEKTGAPDNPRTRMIAWLALGDRLDPARLFDGSQYGPENLDEQEAALAAALKGQPLNHPDMPFAVTVECPPDYEAALRERFGDDFAAEMQAMLTPAPLDLRVNTKVKTREDALESLKSDKVETDPTPYSVTGLRARSKAFLSKTKAFVKGWVEIQDEGSQLIAQICGVQPGMQVLDYCAGAGGKTLALAGAMMNKGRIVAMDLEKSRLEKARPRFKRAGVHDIIEVRPLTDEKSRKWLKRQKGTFDVVLVDAPCSGTGTWRRNPDTRWRVYGPGLDALLAVQAEILDRVAKTVKPGGRLVYATCSLLPAENDRQVEAFLQRHPEFTAAPPSPGLPADGPYMRLTPHRHNTDGFFAAVLTRNPDAQ